MLQKTKSFFYRKEGKFDRETLLGSIFCAPVTTVVGFDVKIGGQRPSSWQELSGIHSGERHGRKSARRWEEVGLDAKVHPGSPVDYKRSLFLFSCEKEMHCLGRGRLGQVAAQLGGILGAEVIPDVSERIDEESCWAEMAVLCGKKRFCRRGVGTNQILSSHRTLLAELVNLVFPGCLALRVCFFRGPWSCLEGADWLNQTHHWLVERSDETNQWIQEDILLTQKWTTFISNSILFYGTGHKATCLKKE